MSLQAESIEIPGLELEPLLDPLSGANPAGADGRLTAGSCHARILAMIREASEDRNYNWRDVLKETTYALSTGGRKQTDGKDLEIAAWLIKALIKVYGFRGLSFGFRLVRGLHDRYWETMYPKSSEESDQPVQPDAPLRSEDIEDRAAILRRLDRYLQEDLRLVPLVPSPDSKTYHLNAWDAAETDALKAELDTIALRASIHHVQNQLSYLAEGSRELTVLVKIIEERYGAERAPKFDDGLGALSDCTQRLQFFERSLRKEYGGATGSIAQSQLPVIASDASEQTAQAPPRPAALASLHQATEQALTRTSYYPRDREEALGMLSDAAAYLRALEPLSPLSYLIQKAVRWGRMTSIGDWLKEVMSIPQDPQQKLFRDLGLDEVAESHSSGRVPLSRQDALQMLHDASTALKDREPLSPIPYLVQRAIRWGAEMSFAEWLQEGLPGQDESLAQISRFLGLGQSKK